MPVSTAAPLTLLLLAAVLSSCRPADRVEVKQSRTAFRNEAEPSPKLTDKQRFASNLAQVIFTWKTPEGWAEKASAQFRDINFTFGPNQEGECYISIIDGDENSMLDNFNRWRKQMGKPELTKEEIAAMPVKNVLKHPVRAIDVTGTYSAGGPMAQSSEPRADWRLVGTMFAGPPEIFGLCTIKLTGPKDLVEKNLAAFDGLLTSLDWDPILGQSVAE